MLPVTAIRGDNDVGQSQVTPACSTAGLARQKTHLHEILQPLMTLTPSRLCKGTATLDSCYSYLLSIESNRFPQTIHSIALNLEILDTVSRGVLVGNGKQFSGLETPSIFISATVDTARQETERKTTEELSQHGRGGGGGAKIGAGGPSP